MHNEEYEEKKLFKLDFLNLFVILLGLSYELHDILINQISHI